MAHLGLVALVPYTAVDGVRKARGFSGQEVARGRWPFQAGGSRPAGGLAGYRAAAEKRVSPRYGDGLEGRKPSAQSARLQVLAKRRFNGVDHAVLRLSIHV